MTNVVLTPELKQALATYRSLTTEECDESRKKSSASPMMRARRVTEAIMDARKAFHAAPRRTKAPYGVKKQISLPNWDKELSNDELRKMEVLVFDGVCNLCNGAMQFMDKWATPEVRLAWMQDPLTLRYLAEYGIDKEIISKSFAFIVK